MKKLVREYWGIVLLVVFVNLLVISSLFIKVKHDVTTPASITNVSTTIDIEDAHKADINTVSVFSYQNVNLLSYLIGKINKNATVEPTSDYVVTDLDLVYTSGAIQKRVSIYNAIISGYKLAGYNEIINDDSYKGYIIHTLSTFASPELAIGDIIISFNNVTFKGFTGENEFENLIDNIIFEKNKQYPITVLRKVKTDDGYKEEELSFNISTNYFYNYPDKKIAAFGIYTYEYIEPTVGVDIPEYDWNYGDSIGPSGGLMQALYVYDALTGSFLTRNKKIVGTGTVDAYGNAGAIGGIYQKVITASLYGTDIFFVPVSSLDEEIYKNESNYIDAMEAYQKLESNKMKLVPVSSLEDIVEYLKNN